MKIVGIIAEYNPFHAGHAYHIEETRKQTGADYIVVVMSGDFVQRGAPAFLPKHTRTQMALLGGADVVFELPATHACQSAELFALGGVTLLNGLGCVDQISFGSESGNIEAFEILGNFLSTETVEYQDLLKKFLKNGISYPAARQQAIEILFSSSPIHQEISTLLASPNNILGIEYCKALNRIHSNIKPFTMVRTGSDYHSQTLEGHFPSASAIRAKCVTPNSLCSSDMSTYFPSRVFQFMNEQLVGHTTLTEQDFSLLFRWMLYSHSTDSLCQYMDINPELGNRLINTRNHYETFSQFLSLLKTKELTYSRLSRALFHILLDIKEISPLCYARLLGFKKSAAPVLREIKKHGTIPLITKLADASSILSQEQMALLEKNVIISNLYENVLCEKYKKTFVHEYKKNLIII